MNNASAAGRARSPHRARAWRREDTPALPWIGDHLRGGREPSRLHLLLRLLAFLAAQGALARFRLRAQDFFGGPTSTLGVLCEGEQAAGNVSSGERQFASGFGQQAGLA